MIVVLICQLFLYGMLIEVGHDGAMPGVPNGWAEQVKNLSYFNGPGGHSCGTFKLLRITQERRYSGRLWFNGRELTGRRYRRAIKKGVYFQETAYESNPVRLYSNTPERNRELIQRSVNELIVDGLTILKVN